PGAARRPSQAKPAKKKGRGVSGNPAKRNAPAAPAAADPAAAFGGQDLDPAALQKAIGDFQLPPDLSKLLQRGQ
ncbi:MAG: signal recognition particle protein, partial [Actinomycetes bacterium]